MTTINPDCTCTPFIPEPCPVCAAEIEQRNADPLGTMPAKDSLETQLYDEIDALKAQNARLVTVLLDLIARTEAIDGLLLDVTNTPRDCELGEIARARAAIQEAKP